MTKKKRVLVDIDGVICDFVTPVLDIIEQQTGIRHKFEAINTFEINKALNLTDEQYKAMGAAIMTEGFCTNLKPLPGAIEGFQKLREIADVFVVTSPFSGQYWEGERRAWCVQHLGIEKSRVFSGGDKYIVQGDYLVDDRLETCELWDEQKYNGRAIVFDSPWNKRPWYGLRAYNWNEVISMVTRGA